MLPYNRRLKTQALHLWYRLRRKQILGVQFYRQKPVGNYIADFYAPAAKLVVEPDGLCQREETSMAEPSARKSACCYPETKLNSLQRSLCVFVILHSSTDLKQH
jgi:hypothetical protein